jgi:hypothetical protein
MDSNKVRPLKEHFEPLLIFVCLPYLSSSPRLAEKGFLLEELRGTVLQNELPEVATMEYFAQISLTREVPMFPVRALGAVLVINH